MQFSNYFFASLVSFLGLLVGIVLVKIAPEEQKPLEKNFHFLRKVFLLMALLFLVPYYLYNFFYMAILALIFVFLIFIEYRISGLCKKSMLAYPLLGILFFLSSKNTSLFAIESSLIFLHGLPTASLIWKEKEKNYSEVFAYSLGFVAIANLLYLI